MSKSLLDGWALAREGQIREGDTYVHVLTVEAKSRGATESVVFVQRFQPFASGTFKLLGPPIVSVGGKTLSNMEAKPLLVQLLAGVQTYPKAAEHWHEWSAP